MQYDIPKFYTDMALFQCIPNGKFPATKNGFKDAKFGLNPYEIVQNRYNVAIALSMSALICIDCDVDEERGLNGLETLAKYEVLLGKLPRTLTQKTPRDGRHFIFLSKGILNPIGKIEKDIDVKFQGYCLCYPSSINGKRYEIIDGVNEKGEFEIAELPQKWLDFINKNTSNNIQSNKSQQKSTFEPKVYEDLNIEKIFSDCEFLKYCKENADSLTEPEWHSMITILAQIKDSDELIHSLSEPYPKYSFEETQKKIDYARQFGHSQTCAYLSANYPHACDNCASKIRGKEV